MNYSRMQHMSVVMIGETPSSTSENILAAFGESIDTTPDRNTLRKFFMSYRLI